MSTTRLDSLTLDGTLTMPSQAVSFTPGISFGGGTTGITYGTRYGYYTKIANVVFFILRVTLTNKGSSTGTALVTGLPITSIASVSSAVAVDYDVLTFSGQVGGLVSAAATTIGFNSCATGASNVDLTHTAFSNTTTLFVSGFYFV
jgi:hypothetical protein